MTILKNNSFGLLEALPDDADDDAEDAPLLLLLLRESKPETGTLSPTAMSPQSEALALLAWRTILTFFAGSEASLNSLRVDLRDLFTFAAA